MSDDIKGEFSQHSVSSKLPEWLKQNPVELHWEGGLKYLQEDGTPDKRFNSWLKKIQTKIKEMGPVVTVGLAKHGAEGAWWPSRVGESLPEAKNRNIYKEFFLDPMESSGIKYVAYYRHDIDKAMEKLHPDWVSQDADGKSIPSDRDETAHRLCFNSPYREFVKTRLVELAGHGTPGVYFDQDHMHEVCTCQNCQKKFLTVRGYPMPKKLKPYTREYLDVAKFIGETISATFAEWRAAVRKANSDMVFIAGADTLVDFKGIHHAESLSDSIDVFKSEFQKCFGDKIKAYKGASPYSDFNLSSYTPTRAQQESLSWIIARDMGGGRPAHIWNYKPDKDFGETFHTNMALVAHGNISSTTVEVLAKEHSYGELFNLSRLLGKEFSDSRPYGWVGVYISNSIKEQAYVSGGDGELSFQQRFKDLYAPVSAAVEVLQQEHIPFITLFDKDILSKNISPLTNVVIVPSADKLPMHLKTSLSIIQANGTQVIPLSSQDRWFRKTEAMKLQEKLMSDIVKRRRPPIQIEAPPDVRVNYFLNHQGTGLLVTAVRDWNNFWFFGDDRSQRRSSLPEQEPITGMKLVIRDPSIQVASAKIIDFDASPEVEKTKDGRTLLLPPLSIYQFMQVNLSK